MSKFLEVNADALKQSMSEMREAYLINGGFIVRKLLPRSLLHEVAHQVIAIITLIDCKIKSPDTLSLQNDPVRVASNMLVELENRHPGSQSIVYDAMDHTRIMYKIAALYSAVSELTYN